MYGNLYEKIFFNDNELQTKKKKSCNVNRKNKTFLVIFYLCAFLFQGIRFVAFVHESRALTENKEIKDDD